VIPAFRARVPRQVISARAEAHAVLEGARAEAEALRTAALDRVSVAVASARAEARAEADAALARELAEARLGLERWRAAFEAAAVEAAVAVAEQVWRGASVDRSAAAAAAAEALAEGLAPGAALAVRCHPGDLPAVAATGLAPTADRSLAPGDCVVEVPDGLLDARASVRARLAVEALAAALGRGAPDAGEAP